jgi:hypothetical protein
MNELHGTDSESCIMAGFDISSVETLLLGSFLGTYLVVELSGHWAFT